MHIYERIRMPSKPLNSEKKMETKEKERELLLRKIFPNPYPGSKESLIIFTILKELGDPYCSKYNENGYTTTYEQFDSTKVVSNAARILSDDKLLHYAEKYQNSLNKYIKFKGEYYTYDPKSRTLKLGSEWGYIEKRLRSFLQEYGTDGQAVLQAIWDVSVEKQHRWKNYYMVQTAAREGGMRKGWMRILSHLQLIDVLEPDLRNLEFPEELVPLIEKTLAG